MHISKTQETDPVFEFRHLGINPADEVQSERIRNFFTQVIGLNETKLKESVMLGGRIELMPPGSPGKSGHIGLTVESIEKAAEYLSGLGIGIDYNSAVYHDDGRIKVVYLKEEIGGFAVHLFEE